MRRNNYSKLKNTWLSDDRQPTYSYTDPTPKGLVVFDIDDTLRVVNGQWSDCQWRTKDCGFPNNNLADTQTRAVNAINFFYDIMKCDIAVYTKETNDEVVKSGALDYVAGLAKYINNPKFKNDIVDDYKNNKGFGTSTKLNRGEAHPNKGKGLKILADNFNIPHNKVVMFDDSNNNIKDIIDNGFCGITVSNTPNICGISEQNLKDAKTFMNNEPCIKPIPNPSKFIDDNDHSKGVKCAQR
jgi:hypothetical protein